jgi:hypothetical protein
MPAVNHLIWPFLLDEVGQYLEGCADVYFVVGWCAVSTWSNA